MLTTRHLPGSSDRPLFTPGPLTTSRTVKQAMLRDLGSRERDFISVVRSVRETLLSVAGVSQLQGYECVLLQGSGTYALEAVLSSSVPPKGKVLLIINGAYGERMASIACRHGIETVVVTCAEHETPDPERVEQILAAEQHIAMTAVVHCETTSGILNPLLEIGALAHQYGSTFFVDSMSAFGAIPFDLRACRIDFLVSSANKCIEGVPGFAFVICRREALFATEGWARTLSLDLFAQWQGLENNGQFRFTPPTHAILAFEQALAELEAEGGVAGRYQRYQANRDVLVHGLRDMGFEEYLAPDLQSPIITSIRYPEYPQFDFDDFYNRLGDKGYVIYPGKVSDADCFRIGTIGRLFPSDVRALLLSIREVLLDMGLPVPLAGSPAPSVGLVSSGCSQVKTAG